MSTDRDGKREGNKSESEDAARFAGKGLRLANGVRLELGVKKGDVPVLVSSTGNVQLNGSAVAILRLCDGSRDRDAIVAELVAQSHGRTLAADIVAFLDVARDRGWIREN